MGDCEETQHQNSDANFEELQHKIQEHESEKKRIQDEFNIQRAKMKELYLQKEEELSKRSKENIKLKEDIIKLQRELDDIKSQLVVAGLTLESNFEVEKRKAAEEIASLQQLVHETVEESSSSRTLYDTERKKLQSYIVLLEHEIKQLKHDKQQSPHHSSQEQSSLAPSVVINALTKGIAKKLGADAFSSQDPPEESFRKVENNHTQEDAEVLRSLVGPLEDQIKALKEKLRATDEQLQKCKECGHQETEYAGASRPEVQSTISTNTSFDKQPEQTNCDMCTNYEDQLVSEQKTVRELESKVLAAEKAVDRHKEELLKEIGFRKDMEEKWNEKKEEHKQQVAELTRCTECAEQDLKELRQYFNQTSFEMQRTLEKLTRDREAIQQELLKLQTENDNLVGKYTIHSQELQSEAINLPDTVEELQELILKHNQDLIIAKIGKEAAEEEVNNLRSDIVLLSDQITTDQQEKENMKSVFSQELNALKRKLGLLEHEKKVQSSNQESTQTKIAQLEEQLAELRQAKKSLEEMNNEYKTRISSLQQELDTSETVQKDFVRLSQSLQVQLEKIRGSDTQVRWQFEEDVEDCPSCKSTFTKNKSKVHCQHCGQIFCEQCLSRTVNSGPRMRPCRVCDVCHTLLDESSAPYFSETPPMT